MRLKLRSKKPITADELLNELEKDPAYQQRLREADERAEHNRRTYRHAAEGVLRDLRGLGLDLEAVGELVTAYPDEYKTRHKEIIPILLRWLPLVDYDALKDDIVRTLTVPWARRLATRPLIERYKQADDPEGLGRKWVISNALEVLADDRVFDEIVELVRDESNGRGREMLTLALGKMKDPRAFDVLVGLLRDEVVFQHAIIALGRLKDARAVPHIRPFYDDQRTAVRQAAKTALGKIERANRKSQDR